MITRLDVDIKLIDRHRRLNDAKQMPFPLPHLCRWWWWWCLPLLSPPPNVSTQWVSILPIFNFQEFQNWHYSIFKSFKIDNIQYSRVSKLAIFNIQEFQNWQYSIFESFKIGNIQYSLGSILTIFNIQEFQYCDIQEFVRVLIKPKLELLARQRGGHFDADVLHIIEYF